MKRYLIGTEIHQRTNSMTEVDEEKYREHYKVSETYIFKVSKAKKLLKSKREAALAEAEELQDFRNGMLIGVVEECEE